MIRINKKILTKKNLGWGKGLALLGITTRDKVYNYSKVVLAHHWNRTENQGVSPRADGNLG